MKGDEAFAKRKQGVQKNELNEQLKDYINQWRDERSKEEAELKRLKDKQAARKEIRAEQDRLQAQKKKEEDARKKAEAEKKAAEEEVKKKAMEEAEIKRQEMMAAQKEGGKKSSGPAMDARKEMSKTKEQVEEEMKISLRIRIKPLDLDSMDSDELKRLAERQKLQQRNKAIKKGLDPESFTQKHPPTIRMFSKYERRTDTRSYGDRKKLYEGSAEVIRAEWLDSMWKEKFAEFSKRPAKKLPKWFGLRTTLAASSRSSRSAPPRSCQSGSESDLAKRLAIRRRPRLKRRPRRSTRRKRRKRRLQLKRRPRRSTRRKRR